jgi:hypothetical protein
MISRNASGLPREGQRVEFVLDNRDVAIIGTYGQRIFQSRWSGYAVENVRAWRYAEAESAAAVVNEANRCVA